MLCIAGIDPGMTAAVALIDIASKTREWHTFSSRNFSISDIIDYIAKKGKPIVVATDRSKPPAAVKKIAAAFGARLFCPKDDLTNKEKKDLVVGFSPGNTHEVDSLAAALSAKQFFLTTLEKVESEVIKEKQNIVKALLIREEAGNIESALEMIATKKIKKVKEKVRKKDSKEMQALRRQLSALRERNMLLEKRMKELEGKEKVVVKKTDTDDMKNLRKSLASFMKEKNETIKKLRGIIDGEYEIVVVYGPEEGMRDRIVLLNAPTEDKIRRIEDSGAKAIITETNNSKLVSTLPIIDKRNVKIEKADKFLIARSSEVNDRMEFTEWLEEYRRRYEKA